MTRVIIDGKYTYETDLALEVGDEVLLPAGWSGEWIGKVTATASQYRGPCKRIIRIVHRRPEAERREAAMAAVPITGFSAGATVRITAPCGHEVIVQIEEINRTGRPTRITYTCASCGGVPSDTYLGSANAWRWYVAGRR